MRELSWLAIVLGVVVGALLAAANAFVGLKVGMTISASIPAAVVSLLVLKTLLKRGTLLESNMVQTIGSAGESVATGMIFTLPALFIMGNDPQYLHMVIWGGIGGLLGVCFMIPLRQVLIVRERDVLPYPEGVACAEVLESGERGGAGAKSVIWGAIVGAGYYLMNGLGFFAETGVIALKPVRTEAQLDSSPALLGIGYILGARIAAYMLAGAVLAWFVLIPAIAYFGAGAAGSVFPEETRAISAMTPMDIWDVYVRYIGAGAVAIGGLIALVKSFPTIASSFWHVLTGFFGAGRGSRGRTEKDIPFPLLVLMIAGLGYVMWRVEAVKLDAIGAVAVLVFTFFFVTVSSRVVGLVGSSSNPVSGMTIATLLATALIYKFFVVADNEISGEAMTTLKVTCLSVGAIVCIAISVAGDTSQDLKTGYLLRATPYKQQIGEMLGVITSVVAIAGVLLLLNHTLGFVKSPDHPHPLLAPQANIMKILIDGVLGGNVPWTLIMMGGAAAVIVEMLGLPALPFAVGLYLPLGLSTPIMVGGIIRWLIDRKRRDRTEHDPGLLTAAGLVAGKGLMGVALAGMIAMIAWLGGNPRWLNPSAGHEEPVVCEHFVPWLWSKFGEGSMNWGLRDAWWDALPFFPFAVLAVWLWWCARKRPALVLPSVPAPVPAGPERSEPSDSGHEHARPQTDTESPNPALPAETTDGHPSSSERPSPPEGALADDDDSDTPEERDGTVHIDRD